MIYKGEITLHTEQGCGQWVQFHDNRGLSGDKKQYWNWTYTINLVKCHPEIKNLKIFDENDKLIYDAPWTYDRKNTLKNECVPSPLEITAELWRKMLSYRHYRCEIDCNLILPTKNGV